MNYRSEKFFLHITTAQDREKIKFWLGAVIVLMMRGLVAKNLFVAGVAFCALFLIYLIK